MKQINVVICTALPNPNPEPASTRHLPLSTNAPHQLSHPGPQKQKPPLQNPKPSTTSPSLPDSPHQRPRNSPAPAPTRPAPKTPSYTHTTRASPSPPPQTSSAAHSRSARSSRAPPGGTPSDRPAAPSRRCARTRCGLRARLARCAGIPSAIQRRLRARGTGRLGLCRRCCVGRTTLFGGAGRRGRGRGG